MWERAQKLVAISELTSIRPQQITPVGTQPQGRSSHAAPKAAAKAHADTVDLSDQARAQFQKWQENRENGTEPGAGQDPRGAGQLLPDGEGSSSSPEDLSAAPPPSVPPEIVSGEADTETTKLYEEPEPAGADRAKSLRVMGYSLSMIATKMNLDVETVKQYLGVG